MNCDANRILYKVNNYSMPTNIYFGLDASKKLPDVMDSLGVHNALILTDKQIMETGIIERIEGYLVDGKKEYTIFDKARPNPTVESVNQALDCLKQNKPDVIIAIGGGSSIDTAKVAAILETNPAPITTFDGKAEKFSIFSNPRRVKLIAIDTAAGTGSEVTIWAPVIDFKIKRKMRIGSPYLAPEVAICDPLLTVSMPPNITAETGMDALSHALECYVTKGIWEIPDALAIRAIELVFKNLRRAVNNGKDIEARTNLLMASVMAGMAFPHAGVGMVHGMGEPLSGFCDLGHGLTMAQVMPYVEEFNLPACYERFANIARVAGENIEGLSIHEAGEKGVNAIKSLAKDIRIPTLKAVGVKKEDIPEIAKEAFSDPDLNDDNPRKMTLDDIKNIYEKAYNGEIYY